MSPSESPSAETTMPTSPRGLMPRPTTMEFHLPSLQEPTMPPTSLVSTPMTASTSTMMSSSGLEQRTHVDVGSR